MLFLKNFFLVGNWQAEVFTSKIVGAGTSGGVYLTLYGDRGKSDEVALNEAASVGKNGVFFEQGTCRTFQLNLPPIGIPNKLRIRHAATEHSPNWHLEKVLIVLQ